MISVGLDQVCSLYVSCRGAGDGDAEWFAALGHMPSLHTLTLRLEASEMSPNGAAALAHTLKQATSLHTIALNLECSCMGDAGVQALAALKDVHSLQTLDLSLVSNHVGDRGAQALEVCSVPIPVPVPVGILAALILWGSLTAEG